MTVPDLSTPESLAQARAEAVALLEGTTSGEWKAFPRLKYDEWHVSVPLQDGGGILRLALADNGIRGPNREADAALIAAAPTTTLTLIAALDALATTRQALADAEAERERLQGLLRLAGPMLRAGVTYHQKRAHAAHALPGSRDRARHDMEAGEALFRLRLDSSQRGADTVLAALNPQENIHE